MGLFTSKKSKKKEIRKLKKTGFDKAIAKKKKVKYIIENADVKLALKVKKRQSVYRALSEVSTRIKDKEKNNRDDEKRLADINDAEIRNLIDKVNKNFEILALFSCSIGDIDININELNSKSSIIREGTEVQANSFYAIKQYMDMIYTNLEKSGADAVELSETSKIATQKVKSKKEQILRDMEEFHKVKDLLLSTVEYSFMLEEKSNEAENLLTSIDNISKQTNLLSVNASIEAARAGEQGKGFSIVAQEVRKLSEKTSKTSSDINVLIGLMQSYSQKNHEAMQSSLKEMENHIKIYQKIVDDLNEIEDFTSRSSEGNISLSDNLKDQVDQFDMINQNFAQMMPSIAKNTASINDISAAIYAEANQIGKINSETEEMEKNLIYMLEVLSKNVEKEEGVLIVCAAIYPPFIIYDEEKKEITGIDTDIIKEIAKRANIEVKIDLSSWCGSLEKAEKGLVDVIPSIHENKERAEYLDFSEEFRENIKYVFLTKKGSGVKLNKYEDLYKYTVGTMIGYEYDEMFTYDDKAQKEAVIDVSFLFEKLMQQKIDAMIINEYSADYYLKDENLREDLEKQKLFIVQTKSEQIAFSKKRQRQKEIELLNEKIIEIKQDGTYQEIMEKYLGPVKK